MSKATAAAIPTMQMSIHRADLLRAVTIAASVADPKIPSGLFGDALVQVKDGALLVSATDGTTSVLANLGSRGEEHIDGAVAVGAAILRDAVKTFTGDTVELTAEPGNKLILSCGGGRVTLPGVKADDFPRLPAVDATGLMIIDSAAFVTAVRRSLYAIDQARADNLAGAIVETDGKTLLTAGVSSHRLSTQSMDCTGMPAFAGIVPRVGLMHAAAMLEASTTAGSIGIKGEYFVASAWGSFVCVRVLGGKRVPFEKVIPEPAISIRLSRLELLAAVKRGALVLDKDYAGGFKLTVAGDKVILESSSATLGDARTEINLAQKAEKSVTVSLTWRYLSDALALIEDADVDINLGDELQPITIRPAGNSRQTHLIMVRG